MDSRLKKHPLGYWEIQNRPTLHELQQYYVGKYYQQGTGSYELEYTKDELAYFKAKLEQREAVLRQYLVSGNSEVRFLDVGCGEGYALAFFRERGWSVKGFDFSCAGVESKNPECLNALVTGDIVELLEVEISRGKIYDVVWLQNVLEHVLHPLDLLTSLRGLVSQGGLAVVTVPNDYSITQRAALEARHIDSEFWVAPPDHLTYFDHRSLTNIAEEAGWRCAEMLGDFPIDWFLFHPGSNYVRDPAAGKAAHNARVQIENCVHEQPIADVIQFWAAAAKVGIGRDITAILVNKSKSD